MVIVDSLHVDGAKRKVLEGKSSANFNRPFSKKDLSSIF
jgi:hypothetical protein